MLSGLACGQTATRYHVTLIVGADLPREIARVCPEFSQLIPPLSEFLTQMVGPQVIATSRTRRAKEFAAVARLLPYE